VGSFTQLLLVRVGVAVGESGCVPPAQSLLADYFDRAELPRAMAIYWMSSPLSTVLAFLVGGWLIEQYGWRLTFILIGLPGILLAILVKFTLREPRLAKEITAGISVTSESEPTQVSLSIVLKTLWQKPAFRHVAMAYCVFMFFVAGIGVWIPAFFIRTHGMEAGELGTWLGLTWGFGGLFFTYFGGVLATRYAARQEGLQMQGVALICLLCSVFYILCFLSSGQYLGLLFISLAAGVLLPMTNAAFYASLQSLVEERMRAVALALIFMFSNLVGLGLGPLAVGMASDMLAPDLGQDSLLYALLLFSPGYLWCAYHCWKAAQTIEDEIKLVESQAGLIATEEVDPTSEMPNNLSSSRG
jgi:MFS family permease